MERLKFISNIEQLAYARMSVLADGSGRGDRIIEVNNGSNLQFTIYVDRGMDIVECSFDGVGVAYRSCNGIRSRMEYNATGFEWLRNWQGGLLTTCGLRSAGVPNGEFGLHGRISNQAANDVSIFREWVDDKYQIIVRGVLKESRMFGENLRMVRTIKTCMGENTIQVEDEITNLSYVDDYIQIVYHCNFGYPLIAPQTRLESVSHEVIARDEVAQAGIAHWDMMEEPKKFTQEQCFFHEIKSETAKMTINNPDLSFKVSVKYDTKTLPRMVEWKIMDYHTYALGLEPTNTTLVGRTQEIANNSAQKLHGGESIKFKMEIEFEK